MPNLPKQFLSTGEGAVASYSFIEIATGAGIMTLYAGWTVDTKTLLNNQFASNTIMSQSGNIGGSPDAIRLDQDYDMVVTKPLTVEGTMIITAGIGVYRSGSSNSGYFIFKFRKWDGSSETDIAENQSSTHSNNSTPGWTYSTFATDITIPRTHFKIGDTLRLTVELWGAGGANPSYVAYGHDPQNRTTGWDTTGVSPSRLTTFIPVRVDL